MTKSLLAFLLIAIATLQVAFAETYYCDPPNGPKYGSYYPVKSKYPVGDTVYFRCNYGYQRYGASSAECLYSRYYKRGYWSHKPPVCRRQVTECPKLKLDYGFVKHYGFKPGSKAFHFCNRGFKLDGDKVRVCQKNGYWSGEPPVCKKIVKCPKLKLDYGFVKHNGFTTGSKAFHFCNRCFKLDGNKVRVCKNGYWSGQPPVCKVIDCGKPPKPDYGKVSYKSTKCGSKAFHFCDPGFYLSGKKVRVCQTNGYWSGKTPKCLPRKYKPSSF